MKTKQEESMDGLTILVLIVCSIIIVILIDLIFGGYLGCHIKSINKNELYCVQTPHSNITYSGFFYQLKNSTEDEIERLEWEMERNNIIKIREEAKQCYNDGYDVNLSFDIFEDYGLNCNKIKYINDHLVDEAQQRDGGYIKGSYSGFVSYGSMQGKSYEYVIENVLATGMLIEKLNYHVDCNEAKHNENIDYYDASEFVMYYVDKCVE